MPKICLNMIVRNEADKIERCLASVVGSIDYYAILDTGSTDGTQDAIKKFFQKHNIPGVVAPGAFKTFEQARNDALKLSLSLSLSHANDDQFEYVLLLDADMELVCREKLRCYNLTAPAYSMVQSSATLSYHNTRLLSVAAIAVGAKYKGVTHEYLDCGSTKNIPPEFAHFVDHADGTNRKDKFTRDIKLLLGGLQAEPNNSRYMYYLAQSYRDSGKWKEAAHWYNVRRAAGGWEEEAWDAQLNYGCCLKNLGDEAGFIRETLAAYNRRPWRAEPLYDLAKHYREKPDAQATAAMLAKTGMGIPYPKDDLLFVNRFVYETGCKEEFAIAGFYSKDPAEKQKAFEICDGLSLDIKGTLHSRAQAKSNLYHYLPPLSKSCPSFKAHKIDFVPPDGYVVTNPSILSRPNGMLANVRCVNYTIDAQGRYLIRANDGSITNDNPIHTRNFLVHIGSEGRCVSPAYEIVPDPALPVEYPLVLGLEDIRLFDYDGAVWGSACVRQLNKDGWCEQYVMRLAGVEFSKQMRPQEMRHMKMYERSHEKNWMPAGFGKFVYRMGKVVDSWGAIYADYKPNIESSSISGGSQLIPFRDGYLALVHQAHTKPDGTRFYMHRWAYFDTNINPVLLSHSFYFLERGIEFAAGLAWSGGQHLMMSFGFQDKEPWIATVTVCDVERMLWPETSS